MTPRCRASRATRQPTCAAYAPSRDEARAYLDAGERRATEASTGLRVFVTSRKLARPEIATTELDDLDTPADYETFLASLRA